jgi:adenine deaminase
MTLTGNIVDIRNRRIYPGEITVKDGYIDSIREIRGSFQNYFMPGFIDAHIHIESSMLVPSEFARLAVLHGTVATVSDPHEIANVLGVKGVEYMIANGQQVPFKFYFGAPSCVPATAFETAGATIDAKAVEELLSRKEILYLAEMMNYPGVLHHDPEVISKIAAAKNAGKPVDGHAPGLRGEDAKNYIAAGIGTDHECFTKEEALEKLGLGMKVIIREGSAAKNFEALIDLLPENHENVMFCSDDKHPDDLILGHINELVVRAISRGQDLFKVLQVACLNPIQHYGLPVGDLTVGAPADFIEVADLKSLRVLSTYVGGKKVMEDGKVLFPAVPVEVVNKFNAGKKEPGQFHVPAVTGSIRVIEAIDGELVTGDLTLVPRIEDGCLVPDTERDILKIAVINRYEDAVPSVAFIKGFGLKKGAIASCVAHDSHNIIVLGTDDTSICRAVNLIIEKQGGIAAVSGDLEKILPLPVAGIMSDKDGSWVGNAYSEIDRFAKDLGSKLRAPFMTLSFMGLLVIPSLKLSDLGLFDGRSFSFVKK